ncbi:hypothetical protein FQ330_02245 [Agrococcus sediminis]|uniref:Uncharacterized protein n=1 Tax=Agrococcus sediminis TaxID=2599924 RepID=A0A5M8QPZ2_9MICO|nr:hypothetical protein [Agrococcus sediminis]KAA6436252.1 hypothetical protein FQ330_02245 [Agrococcus sediminis]
MSPRPRTAARPDPLRPEQRAAVRAAGATGLALVATGAGLAWRLLVVALVLAVLRAAVIDLFDDREWGMAVVRWIEGLDASWLVPIVLALVLLAVGLVALGAWWSTRRMRRAGVVGAAAVTLRGAALGTGLQAVLSTLSSWLLGLLGLLVLLTGVVGAWIVAALWVVAGAALSALIGWLAGPRTWLAIARREARRAAATAAVPGEPGRRVLPPG